MNAPTATSHQSAGDTPTPDPRGVYYVTTPIYYVNAKLHIGGAYTTLVGDTLARYYRAQHYRTFYLTGSDEHGQKIANVAAEQGKTPQQLADEIVPYFHELWERLDITHDLFIRTTDGYHERVVQSFFAKLKALGYVYKGHYKTLYCTGCEKPVTLSELDDDGRCPLHKTKPDELEEENYFLKVEPFKAKLREYLTQTPARLLPEERRNKVLADLDGFTDQSVSRRREKLSWGVLMPGDDEHVIWVWFDALINYVSGLLKEEVEKRAAEPDPLPFDELIQCEKFRTFWPQTVHLIGKDILWHHTLVWWTMLLGAGIEPPKLVYAHGWWTVENQKISKALGTAIDPTHIVKRFGTDPLRYFVLREMTFGKDGDFSIGQLVNRINSDLGKGGLGNLVARTLNMVEKYRDGRVPEPKPDALEPADGELSRTVEELAEQYCRHIENYQFHLGLDALWRAVTAANQYIEDQAPFKLAKDETKSARLDCVLYYLCETCRILGAALTPVLPGASQAIAQKLSQAADAETAPIAERIKWGRLQPGTPTDKGGHLFPPVHSGLDIAAAFADGTATVTLGGFLDTSTAPQLEAALADIAAGKPPTVPGDKPAKGAASAVAAAAKTKPSAIVFDLAQLDYCSAPGAKAFAVAKQLFGTSVTFQNAPDDFATVLATV